MQSNETYHNIHYTILGENVDRLIYDRNANWVRVLAGLLPTATVLVAVGAGHLPGDKGLISLLRKEGFTVEPVEK